MSATRLPVAIVFGLILFATTGNAQQAVWPQPRVEPQLPPLPSESSLVAEARAEAIAGIRSRNRAADPVQSAASGQSRNYTGSRFQHVADPSYRTRFRGSYRPYRSSHLPSGVYPFAIHQAPTLSRSGIFYFGHFGRLHPSQNHGNYYDNPYARRYLGR